MNRHEDLHKLRYKNYSKAVGWAMVMNCLSCMTDVIACYLGHGINPLQVSFFRFFFGAVTVLPFMLRKGTFYFKTNCVKWHIERGLLGAIAIASFTVAVSKIPLMQNTCLSFAETILVLPLGYFLLREKVDAARILCTVAGFIGIFVTTYSDFRHMNWWIIVPLFSATFFALSDVVVKKMTWNEHILTSLFYFGVITTILFVVPAIIVWQPLSLKQWALLLMIGINGNLLQVCMFKAFSLSDLSAIMPLRYVEWIMSFYCGVLLFGQHPTLPTIIGGLIIICSSCTITWLEKRKERRRV